MSKINCFDNLSGPIADDFAKAVLDSMTEADEKLLGLKLVEQYYKNLHEDLNSFKKSLGLKEDPYTTPKEISEILNFAPKEIERKPATIETKPKVKNIFSMGLKPKIDDEIYRLELAKQSKSFEGENWDKAEKWLKANFPHIPVYRVKNAIKATNGRQAWGMLHKGAIYLSENAEVGTVYHEVFEAVWKMFTDAKEQEEVLKEFKEREGSFVNKFTGEKTEYSKATDLDAKEQLAEEFRDYVISKETKGVKGFISKLFADIYNFFKEFFLNENSQKHTEELFSKIGNGFYKDYIPGERSLSFAEKGYIDIDSVSSDETSDFRLAYSQQHEVLQQMTYSTLAELLRNNASLFGVSSINKKNLYSFLKEELLSTDPENPGILQRKFTNEEANFEQELITEKEFERSKEKIISLYEDIDKSWDALVEQHAIYLKQYSVEFDENDSILINNEEKDKGADGHADARKVDYFRKANPAIKMLLATIPVVQYSNGKVGFKRNSIGGVSTLPLDKTFITLKNKLYNSIDIEDMMLKLRDLAKNDLNYASLYTRLTKESADSEDEINFKNLSNFHDLELLSAFYKAMKAQNSEVKIVYILPSGEVEIGDAHLATATRQAKQDMFGDILSSLKGGHKYISYDKVNKEYNASKEVKELELKAGNKKAYIAFLKSIGIEFTLKELERLEKMPSKYRLFEESVDGIKKGISSISKLKDINKYTFNLEKRLTGLGSIRATLSNPDFESTYFSINGEKTQTYIGTNIISNLYALLSKATHIDDLRKSMYSYLLTDNFVKNSSIVLDRIFNPKTGKKREGIEGLLSTGIVEGIVDQSKGKSKESSNITSKDRLIQELNLNHKGWFLNLVPGDASIEWMVKMFDENNPFVDPEGLSLGYTSDTIFDVFKNYFISELLVSREGRRIVEKGGRKSTDLRFFKSILDSKTHDKIVNNKKDKPEKVYEDNKAAINKSIESFIKDKAKTTLKNLKEFNIVTEGEEGLEVENLDFAENIKTEKQLLTELEALQANYIISNIEMHKLYYSDPYFYADELKRIKNFNSPGQDLMSSKRVDESLQDIFNKDFKKNQIGYYDFLKKGLVSATLEDIESFIEDLKGYESWTETDGAGLITMQAYRDIRIRSANWNSAEETQYLHDMAYERLVKSNASEKELDILNRKNPNIKSAYTPLKPIVRGSKQDGYSYNDIVLDKFALVPLSYRVLHTLNKSSNAIKHYQRMIDTGVDYTVFKSGRKVGAGFENTLYNKDGSYDSGPFLETNEIPYDAINIQTEVPSKDTPQVTQGSQITKLVTLDFMDAGVPLDFEPTLTLEQRFVEWTKLVSEEQKEKKSPVYALIKKNQTLLSERIKEGYNTLLNRLGIQKVGKSFIIKDSSKLIDTLTDEIYKREINANIIEAFKGFKSGQVVLEATPVYQQIRNILYSIANKEVTRPTISGGMKVQIASTLLESVRAEAVEYEDKDGNTKTRYVSKDLNFYSKNEDGKTINVCEVMIGRWFESDMSDKDLLKYLNTTEEGQKILKGIGFRIPTQKQNSIDSFVIKQFLPSEFGDSVVIPSALVNKAGSDFDIDKLSMYFKNVYKDIRGNIKLIPFLGYGEKAKEALSELYNEGAFLNKETRNLVNTYITNRKEEDLTVFSSIKKDEVSEKLFNSLFGKGEFEDSYVIEVLEDILDSKNEQEVKSKIIDQIYKKSLENEYIQSLEDLVSHPLNYDKLIEPNSAKQLKTLSADIVKRLGFNEVDYSSTGNMLDREFMQNLRSSFVRGKYAIGIAATAQTNHSQNQRTPIFIDYDKLEEQSKDDKKWLGDGKIKFKSFNKLDKKPTLSLSRNSEKSAKYPSGQLISDLIGQFIDGYVDISKGPWIMELGATPNTAGTWLFLIKLGVPINDIAYFMNQPIIRDLLKEIESAGYSRVFNDRIAKDVSANYSSNFKIDQNQLPSSQELSKMVGKKVLSEKEKAEQLFILEEFFKYSKLAEHLFYVQQGSNFDTANISDPYIVFKKRLQLERAEKTMISSVNSLLKKSFVGVLKDVIYDMRDVFSTILISDKPGIVRNTLEKVLTSYIDMSDRDFIKISQKAVSDLFDWAVQTDPNNPLNKKIKSILLGKDNESSAAEEIMSFIKGIDEEHPLFGNYVIQSLKQSRESIIANKPQNLYLTGKNNKIYDQNNIIYGFAEIKDYLKGIGNLSLYKKLVELSVLQSGLSNSKVSFTQLLPYEDFQEIYNETLSSLEKMSNLGDFAKLNVFERNNWNNTDIVAAKKSKWLKLKTPFEDPITGNLRKFVKVPEIEFLHQKLKGGVSRKIFPPLIQLSPYSKEGRADFVAFTWEKDFTKAKKAEMRKKGDYSYINRGLFKKVYNEDGTPFITTYKNKKGQIYENYIYKAINAWGDSFRANEFYIAPQESVIDNGFIKVEKELEDDTAITDLFKLVLTKKENIAASPKKINSKIEVVSRYSLADVKANPNKVYVFGDNTQREGTRGQAQIRNSSNAMGIATKLAPSNEASAFMTDKDLSKNKAVIDGDIAKIKATTKSLVFPKDGLGTGLAKLKEKAPKTYAYLKQRLLEEFGFNNDTGEIESKENEDPLTKC